MLAALLALIGRSVTVSIDCPGMASPTIASLAGTLARDMTVPPDDIGIDERIAFVLQEEPGCGFSIHSESFDRVTVEDESVEIMLGPLRLTIRQGI